ncbi:MAG: ROK family protein [Cyclobacteriaceae bacterium]|nr:ROK family protein [Cyclobacteriaceae bacterium]
MSKICIDTGGTNIKIGLIEKGKIIARGGLSAVSDQGLEPRLNLIVQKTNQMIQEVGIDPKNINGVGMAIPGIVDTKAMKTLSINDKYNDVVDLDLPAWAENSWGVPFLTEGDARAAIAGSWQYGSGKGVNDLALITLGTGIGSAVIIDGQILYGKHFQAGILCGHFIVDFHGKKCNCGNVGCAEAHASSWQLLSLIRQHPGFNTSALKASKRHDFETVFRLAKEGDGIATEIRNYCIDVWAATVINMIHAYDPELVLLSGGVMKSSEVIIPAIREKVNEHAWTPWGKVKIKKEEHMDDAALLGLAYLLEKKYKL